MRLFDGPIGSPVLQGVAGAGFTAVFFSIGFIKSYQLCNIARLGTGELMKQLLWVWQVDLILW
jgi:hypothetical protein